jgi:DNA (cytosine-5)-methyltransferase 1
MNMRSFYNDTDAYCCSWLSNLMDAGLITPGIISDTPIERLDPTELSGFRRVHLFAGLGGWERACQFADWGDRFIWTGSAPCQPFSLAGARHGIADHRHLWPDFFRLIRALRPALVVGEQTSGRLGYSWFDGVATDLERENYACRAVDIPACAIDAPHRRNRLYWVALADAASGQLPQPLGQQEARDGPRPAGKALSVGHTSGAGLPPSERPPLGSTRRGQEGRAAPEPSRSFWDDHIWITGADGKTRRIPGQPQFSVRGVADGLSAGMDGVRASTIQLLTHGEAQRVAKLRALGNAIVPQLAAEVLRALKP